METKRIWEILPRLTEVVRKRHEEAEMKASGHPFDHTLQVAQCALLIVDDEEIGVLAGAAGLCHNADRIIQKEKSVGKQDIPGGEVAALVEEWLRESGEISERDHTWIINAVLDHSGPNHDDGDEVLEALQDADRVVCSMADTIMGAAQFWRELPPIDPRHLSHDPEAHSYHNPRSVLKNQECRFDWVDPNSPFCVRLPKAMELMNRRVGYIRGYIKEIEEQRREIGLWPDYPFGPC